MTGATRPPRVLTGELIRQDDPTGISGTGVVAELAVFSDGVTVVRWRKLKNGIEPTTVVHPTMGNVLSLHGHDGKTYIRWHDRHEVDETSQ